MGETPVRLHPHAVERAEERGATEAEVIATVERGESIPAKHGRAGFRRNFAGQWKRRSKTFDTKQVLAYAARADDGWLVVTVIVKFF